MSHPIIADYSLGSIIHFVDEDLNKVLSQYEAIQVSKGIISIYGMNGRHYLVCWVDSKTIKKVKKENKK